MSFAKAGVTAGEGPVRPADLAVLQQAAVEAVRLRAGVNPVSDLGAYRGLGIQRFLVQLLSPRPGTEPTPPDRFVEDFAPLVAAFLREGVTDFEIHGEPNTAQRGYGVSWDSPAAFSAWFVAVAEELRRRFGPPLRVGFPGLAPAGPSLPGLAPVVPDEVFLNDCRDALTAADFVCCHVYWATRAEMENYNGALRFLRLYLERPEVRPKPVVLSQFANINPAQSDAEKGAQYADFYFFCTQYDRIEGAYSFLLRSPDPGWAGLTWLRPDGTPTAIPDAVGSRRRMPHPAALRLVWPTVTRAYTQAYGDRQQIYYEASWDPVAQKYWLHGGHEGVDLQAAEGSPVLACLRGQAECASAEAYGNYVRVTSHVPGVGQVVLFYCHLREILVPHGATVSAGEVIGLAGRTGYATGPHLHLGMRIGGLKLRPNSDYLNARRYLEPVRGSPRVPYERTYVLLPPQADRAWAEAVVEATWDTRRFTVGGSADDAGIGDLSVRRVVAVNPGGWPGDLRAFFEQYYPGVAYIPVEAGTPEELVEVLQALPPSPGTPGGPPPSGGLPRVQYGRTYVLLPPLADWAWARAVVAATWDRHRYTVGGSADDAGIGDLDFRRVMAVNPAGWGGDLRAFFERYYPGIIYVPVEAGTPEELADWLKEE
ncbi:MAG: M23 family metallopeptidase [Thermoflexales bacterium]|nr:M23 family metallopeptidase [Thermoflexales bacterium]